MHDETAPSEPETSPPTDALPVFPRFGERAPDAELPSAPPRSGELPPTPPGYGERVPGVGEPWAPAPPRRRRRTGRVIGTIAASFGLVALLAGGLYGWEVVADQRVDVATQVLTDRETSLAEAQAALAARVRSSQAMAERTREVVSSAPFAADPDATAEPLRAALAALDVALASAAAPADSTAEPAAPAEAEPGSTPGPAFTPPWELMATADDLDADARQTAAAETDVLAIADGAADAEAAVSDAEAAYFGSLATRARAEVDASPLASRKTQVDLGYLIHDAAEPGGADYRDAAFLAEFQAAQQALRDSQAVETAELADPAFDTRREVEAYARSLSAGIVLDFVWAPEVSGLGEDWLSGTAETYDSDGGWAIISLNYTVEEAWADGDENARALVAHEVGHTQVFRDVCAPLFTGPVFGSDHETWATAYSIGLGFDLPGSGIEAYGRPSDEQIATTTACR